MENELITGIISALRALACEETAVYIDEVKQGFVTPAFFVHTLSVKQTAEVGARYRRRYFFDVEYHPADDTTHTRELAEMADALLLSLEYVTLTAGLTRGTDISCEVQDGVLHFFVAYEIFVYKVLDKEEYMMTLTQNQGVKE